jgi:hypothetical protein
VVVENRGATDEAVQEIWLLFGRYRGPERGIVTGGSVQDSKGEPLPPRRNVRRTYDLLAGRFIEFPQ